MVPFARPKRSGCGTQVTSLQDAWVERVADRQAARRAQSARPLKRIGVHQLPFIGVKAS